MAVDSPLKRQARKAAQAYRKATSSLRPLPHFLIIGAQKAGTSSLFSYLAQHPKVQASRAKEIHYYDLNFDKGDNWYRSFFPLNASCTGEASPYYLFHPHAAKRIAQSIPEVKLIVLLRNPTERAISQYFHAVRKDNETQSIMEALYNEEARIAEDFDKLLKDESYHSFNHRLRSYRHRGHYLEQLEAYWQHFPKEQILVLQSETLFANPKETLARVFSFLDLPEFSIPNLEAKNIGSNRTKVDLAVIEYLNAYFHPYNEALFEALGERFDW